MPGARTHRADLDATPYYHCVSRCVRRAFLCGKDPYTGRDFEHRKEWVESRLLFLARVFAMEVQAYAVMSNHLHVVVRVDRDRAENWSDAEVVRRYGRLFGQPKASLEMLSARQRKDRIAKWRERLWDLSWMMRCLNESIARRANEEDECTGRFWEGRFRCQPLLDEPALVACMAYVDLNPLRAGASSSAENAAFTSMRKRLEGTEVPAGLAPFSDQVPKGSRRTTVPMTFDEYRALLRWTARRAKHTDARAPSAVSVMGLSAPAFADAMSIDGLRAFCALGSVAHLDELAASRGTKWVRGKGPAERLFR